MRGAIGKEIEESMGKGFLNFIGCAARYSTVDKIPDGLGAFDVADKHHGIIGLKRCIRSGGEDDAVSAANGDDGRGGVLPKHHLSNGLAE